MMIQAKQLQAFKPAQMKRAIKRVAGGSKHDTTGQARQVLQSRTAMAGQVKAQRGKCKDKTGAACAAFNRSKMSVNNLRRRIK